MTCDAIKIQERKKRSYQLFKKQKEKEKKRKKNVPLFKAAGLMVPDPSTRSPPTPFIGPEWEVSYMAGQGTTAPKVKEGRRKALVDEEGGEGREKGG